MARITCSGCGKPKGHCYCCLIQIEPNPVNVLILRHPSEIKHALGTAPIVTKGLLNAELIDISNIDSDDALCERLLQPDTFLVFPFGSSSHLGPSFSKNIATLVFLDGTWRKAKRMYFESSTLQAMPAISLDVIEKSRYRLRQSSIEHSLSTLEAVVYGLREIEGSPEAYQNLLDVMDWIVEQQVVAMGLETFRQNYLSKA